MIPFGDWRPDLPDFLNPGAIVARNVRPAVNSYRPLPGLSAQSGALDARCRGAAAANDTSGNTYFYAGDAAKLYQVRNQTVTDKSQAGGYGLTGDNDWEFTTFGTKIIAASIDEDVQSLTIGGAGQFADHFTSTLKPKAHHIDTVRRFLVVGNVNEGSGAVPNRIRWSALGDSTDMDASTTTLADSQDLEEGGAIQRVIGGAEYGVVFQEELIRRMTFEGSPTIFRFDAVDRRRGLAIPNSAVPYGRFIFYIAEDGFFVFNGAESEPLGANKIDREFWGQFDPTNAARVSAAIDPLNKLYIVAFPGTGSSAGAPNKLFLYNWVDQKFAYADIETELVVKALTQGFSLDDLDDLTTDIDDGTLSSFDSEIYKGGVVRFSAFDTAHKLAYFTGDNLEAQIDTTEVQLTPGQRTLVTEAWPIVDGSSVTPTVSMVGRNTQQSTESADTAVSVNDVGFCPVRSNARYHRFRVTIPAGATWDHAMGVVPVGSAAGRR